MSDELAHFIGLVETIHTDASVLVARGVTRDEIVRALDIDVATPVKDGWTDDIEQTGWCIVELPDGVLALEPTGFGDPTRSVLQELSAGGRAVAVVRDNVLAHVRFGAARDGELLFDDNEYMFIEDPSVVPSELRPLFDLAWIDLDDEADDDGPSGVVVGLAMAELVTGVRLTPEDLRAAQQGPFLLAPSQVYAASLE